MINKFLNLIKSNNKIINAEHTLKSKKDTIAVNLSGDIDSPKISIDLEKLMKSQTGKKVEKALNKKKENDRRLLRIVILVITIF